MLDVVCIFSFSYFLWFSAASQNLTGVMELVELLIRQFYCEMQVAPTTVDTSSLPSNPIPSWPMSQLDVIIARSDLKSIKTKPSRVKELKRINRLRDIKITTSPSPSSPQFVDATSVLMDEQCCQSDEEREEEQQTSISSDQQNQMMTFPGLTEQSFHHLVFSLLEQLVGHHGNVQLESTLKCLDQSVMSFALEQLLLKRPPKEEPNNEEKEHCSRLLRLVLRSMVSIVQHLRPLPTDDVIMQLVDVANMNQSDSTCKLAFNLYTWS